MHEIGHIGLGHRSESDLARREADYFAGYALAPSPLIGEYASAGLHEVSSKFWVSLECAEICYSRYSNWVQFGDNHLKDYEIILLNLIKQF